MPKHWKTLAVLGILLAGITAGVAFFSRPSIHTRVSGTSVVLLTPQEFDAILETRDPFVVDVHTPKQTHLPGTDAVIPYNEVATRLAEFPREKDAEIILYCRSGSMSREAATTLVNSGYTNVKHLEGGILAYREIHQGITLTPDVRNLGTVIYGEVATTQFTLTNNTANEMKVTRVSTSCSCTTAQVETMSLVPYAATQVRVSFDPAVHKDDSDLGEVTRTIYIETDNPNFPKVSAAIEATVIKRETNET